jgi:hypothetical protein
VRGCCAAGLPGFSTNAERRHHQHFAPVDDMILSPVQPSYGLDMTYSTWHYHAWVYQEQTLSQRLMVFARDQFFFRCGYALWCEDNFEDHPHKQFSPGEERTELAVVSRQLAPCLLSILI